MTADILEFRPRHSAQAGAARTERPTDSQPSLFEAWWEAEMLVLTASFAAMAAGFELAMSWVRP